MNISDAILLWKFRNGSTSSMHEIAYLRQLYTCPNLEGAGRDGADIRSMMSARFAAANLDGASAIVSSSFASRNRRPHKAGVCASPRWASELSRQDGIRAEIAPTFYGYRCKRGVRPEY